jgi:hypothetical protein
MNITRTQSTFRIKVIKLYGSNCIICGNTTVEAAHIIDKANFGDDDYSKFCEYNGIPLCPNHHTDFDKYKIMFVVNDEPNDEFIDADAYENHNFIGTCKIHCNSIKYIRWRKFKNNDNNLADFILNLIKQVAYINYGFYYDKDNDAIMFP